jgi:pyruvate-formate lyase-activating enzyme
MLVHSFVPVSRANGPGRRAVLWFQGCNLNCPECWNQASHPFEGAPIDVTLEPSFGHGGQRMLPIGVGHRMLPGRRAGKLIYKFEVVFGSAMAAQCNQLLGCVRDSASISRRV